MRDQAEVTQAESKTSPRKSAQLQKRAWVFRPKQIKVLVMPSPAQSPTSAPAEPRFLITGAAGFIGSQFLRSCHSQKIAVLACDLQAVIARQTDRLQHPWIAFEELEHFFVSVHPPLAAIFHFGAISDTQESDWSKLLHFNVEASQRLWQFATQQQIPFFYASSAATYGAGEQGYDDNEAHLPLLQPLNLYGKSKQVFDLWALEQEKCQNHPPAWAGFKFFNVYGQGEGHKGAMASVAYHAYQQIRQNQTLTLFRSHRPEVADGDQKRDFIFIDDVVAALHFAYQKPIKRGIFNLGTGQARSFLELAQAVFAALGLPPQIEWIDTPPLLRPRYQYFTQAVMTKLSAQGFHPHSTALEDGVKKYLDSLQNQPTPP